MPLLTPDASAIVAVAAAGGAGLALLAGLAAHLRVGRLRRAFRVLLGDAEHGDLVGIVGHHVRTVEGLASQVEASRREVEVLTTDLADAVRHVAVVRYDAFGDMGGRLSFSAALLDDGGDGLVISAINGRTETRSYAKGVKAGGSDLQLSPEELQAIGYAVKAGRRSGRAALAPAGSPAPAAEPG